MIFKTIRVHLAQEEDIKWIGMIDVNVEIFYEFVYNNFFYDSKENYHLYSFVSKYPPLVQFTTSIL